jgi:hypothetical protein
MVEEPDPMVMRRAPYKHKTPAIQMAAEEPLEELGALQAMMAAAQTPSKHSWGQ